LTAWNHHTTAGAFRLAKVALRVLQEKGALNLSPEALAREVVDVVYEQAPLESRAVAFQSVLEVTTILFNELFCIGCGRPAASCPARTSWPMPHALSSRKPRWLI
jgi:hypothetical protein